MKAIRALTKKFDGVDLTDFRVSESEIEEAVKAVGPEFLAVLKEAKGNIEAFHREQVRKSWSKTFRDGVELGERFLPIQRVGVYVPGGGLPILRCPWIRYRPWWQAAHPWPWLLRPVKTEK